MQDWLDVPTRIAVIELPDVFVVLFTSVFVICVRESEFTLGAWVVAPTMLARPSGMIRLACCAAF